MQLKLLAILMFFGVTDPAWSLESQPEYQSLTEVEQEFFERPNLMEAEYQSDILTYTKPTHWEYLYISNPYAIDITSGSVSAREFMIDNRAKVRAMLNSFIEFRFYYLAEKNLERDSEHTILEFTYWPSKKLGFSYYGEPRFHKRQDDTGIAFTYKPHERHEIRVFNTFVDVTRLKRNDKPDKFIPPHLPHSRGLVGRLWQKRPKDTSLLKQVKGDFFEYAVRHDTRTRWDFPSFGYIYSYWKLLGMVYGSKKLENLRLNGRAQIDRKDENRIPGEAWRTDRLFLILQTDFENIGPNKSWSLLTGIEYASRKWRSDRGSVTTRDFLPHAWLGMPTTGKGDKTDEFAVGYDLDWHRGTGPIFLRNPLEQNAAVNHRLNLRYEFSFSSKAKLRLTASADLDEITTKRAWEGGNGQFYLNF